MNVLFVIHTPKNPYTAVYNYYAELNAFLEAQGHRVTILAPQDLPSLCRWHARWFPLLYPFWVAWWLIRRGGQYDLASFHSYTGWIFNVLHRSVPAYRRLRTITVFHGLEPLYYNALKEEMERIGQPLRLRFQLIHGSLMPWLIRLSCRRSDRVMCLNSEEAVYLAKNNWGRESKISVVSHGVPHEFFLLRQYAIEVRRLLFVGQWQEMKGIRNLVEAFSVLARNAPELKLWCVGTLLDEERVLASFPKEVRSRIVVRQQVERNELIAIYQDADVFVFPSLFEGFSVALLEAMASALPIVATPAGAASDILKHGINALIISKGDAVALADSVRQLLGNRAQREQLGCEARATAADYELGRVHKGLVAVFENTVVEAPQ